MPDDPVSLERRQIRIRWRRSQREGILHSVCVSRIRYVSRP